MSPTQAALIAHYEERLATETDDRQVERLTDLLISALELALVYAEDEERAEVIAKLEKLAA